MSSMSDRVVGGIMSGFASALLVAAAVPAQAGSISRDESSAKPEASETAPVKGETAKQSDRKFCKTQDVTGSIIPVKICRTKSEWIAAGYDVAVK